MIFSKTGQLFSPFARGASGMISTKAILRRIANSRNFTSSKPPKLSSFLKVMTTPLSYVFPLSRLRI